MHDNYPVPTLHLRTQKTEQFSFCLIKNKIRWLLPGIHTNILCMICIFSGHCKGVYSFTGLVCNLQSNCQMPLNLKSSSLRPTCLLLSYSWLWYVYQCISIPVAINVEAKIRHQIQHSPIETIIIGWLEMIIYHNKKKETW